MVLTTRAGQILGVLAPMPIDTPWWQDIEPVVDAVRAHHGVEVTVLRLLDAARAQAPGGAVTYLAEVEAPVAAAPFDGALDDHPFRAPYARPGGPAADLAWATRALARQGVALVAPPTQVRTWNLSSLWRLETTGGAMWLKVLPPFLARESAILTALAGERVPTLIAADGARVLMPQISGRDLYDAAGPELLEMADLLTDLQARWRGREAELLRLGGVDWRWPALADAIADVVRRTAPELGDPERRTLDAFIHGLGARMEAIDRCGLPDTLVHSDFHPGNLRGAAGALTLLDWGEFGVGHPLLDQAAMLENTPAEWGVRLRARWSALWRVAAPGCDPDRAAALIAPIAVARQAVVYRRFLDNIEPSEHPYHRDDPAERLRRVALLLEGERP